MKKFNKKEELVITKSEEEELKLEGGTVKLMPDLGWMFK